MRQPPIAAIACAIALLLGGCVSRTAPAPPTPAVVPALATMPPAPVAPANWMDRALSPGTWRYAPSDTVPAASYGSATAALDLTLECITARKMVRLTTTSGQGRGAPAAITLRATSGVKTYPAVADSGTGRLVAEIPAMDPHLDALAFSRGRFMVSGAAADLILPSWPEVARVIEDCRG